MCEGIAAEFKGIEFGVKRLYKRSVAILEALAAIPEASKENSTSQETADAERIRAATDESRRLQQPPQRTACRFTSPLDRHPTNARLRHRLGQLRTGDAKLCINDRISVPGYVRVPFGAKNFPFVSFERFVVKRMDWIPAFAE
jgi:hypothetical protein